MQVERLTDGRKLGQLQRDPVAFDRPPERLALPDASRGQRRVPRPRSLGLYGTEWLDKRTKGVGRRGDGGHDQSVGDAVGEARTYRPVFASACPLVVHPFPVSSHKHRPCRALARGHALDMISQGKDGELRNLLRTSSSNKTSKTNTPPWSPRPRLCDAKRRR